MGVHDSDLYDSIRVDKLDTTASASRTPAAEPEDNDGKEPPLVLRTYDLNDLLLEASTPPKRVDELGDGRTWDSMNPSPFPMQVSAQSPMRAMGGNIGGNGVPDYVARS